MATATTTAVKIALILIFVQAGIAITNDMGLFSTNYAASYHNEYTNYTVRDISGYESVMGSKQSDQGTWATIVQATQAFFDGLPLAGKILFSIGITYFNLTDAFHIPALWSGFLQLGIWAVYSLAIAEIATGRNLLW